MSDSEKIPRLSRLTAILLKLQTKAFVSVKELAAHFEVSTRTIYRDITALEQSGVPITAEEGRGFSLIEGYQIPPIHFTESEANALIVASKFIDKTKDASLIRECHQAIDKIKAVLRQEEKQKSNFLAERTIIGKNWNNDRTSAFLSDIQQALTSRTLLKIGYQKPEATEPGTRLVEPFAIYLNTTDNWSLIAFCRTRQDFRSFRVDRIHSLQVMDETFPPHSLSLGEYVKQQRDRLKWKPVT